MKVLMLRSMAATLGLLLLAGSALADDNKEEAKGGEKIGTWRQVAVVIDGKDVPVGPSTLMVVTNEGYTVTVNGQLYQKGHGKVVGGGSPLKSDIVVTGGVGNGATMPQITQILGDVLIGCQAKPGGERPTEFTSKPGSGRTMSVWIRVK